MKYKWLVGVDEAGRGPLAGPVAVGVAVIPVGFDWSTLPGVNDSKKLSERQREAVYTRARQLQKAHEIDFRVSFSHAATIDRIGIARAVAAATARAMHALELDPTVTEVKLDGLLRAPEHFLHQQTIVGGDASERAIGLASILAKVTRDRYMVRCAKRYPEYDFAQHKGYGTKSHRETIEQCGISDIHRKSYCRNCI